jgi:hypothetical protein
MDEDSWFGFLLKTLAEILFVLAAIYLMMTMK